jgi:hypothetical protein
MKEIGARRAEVCHLASHLLAERIPLQRLVVLLKLSNPVASQSLPVRREGLPTFKSVRKGDASRLLRLIGL